MEVVCEEGRETLRKVAKLLQRVIAPTREEGRKGVEETCIPFFWEHAIVRGSSYYVHRMG